MRACARSIPARGRYSETLRQQRDSPNENGQVHPAGLMHDIKALRKRVLRADDFSSSSSSSSSSAAAAAASLDVFPSVH